MKKVIATREELGDRLRSFAQFFYEGPSGFAAGQLNVFIIPAASSTPSFIDVTPSSLFIDVIRSPLFFEPFCIV